jgi:hypothetical protein
MAVNEPIPRAQPEGEVCLRCHNSLATSESLIYLLLIVQVTHSVPRNKTKLEFESRNEVASQSDL